MARWKIGQQTGVIIHGHGLRVADYRMVVALEDKVTVKRRGFTTIHEKRQKSW